MRYLDYITENYFDSSAWEGQSKIDTGIAHTSPTISVRIKYKPKFGQDPNNIWLFCDRIAGYTYAEDSDADSSFRIFGWSGGCFDYDFSGRFTNLNLVDPTLSYDVTFGDCFVYDNINEAYLVQSIQRERVPSYGAHIYVDVNWTYVEEVIIKDGETVVFDGKAAIDDNGHIGLWDEISQTLKYNPDLEMTYIDNVDCTDCSNWEECGYESYEDCQCQQYGECPPDCTDCNNWADCGYESYDDCMCQQYGEDCPPDCTDCNNWQECGYESYDDCQCQQYGICPPEPVEHLKIVDVLRGILIEMTDDEECELASWQYNDMATSNVKLDNKKPSPTAVFYQVTDFEYDLRTGIRREKANILVAFLQKENKLDADGLEQDQIIKEMSDIAFEFMSKVMSEGSLRILNDKIKLKSTFLRSDSNRTGVVLELELEEKSGTCFQ